jgi:hypothetical protein
MFTGMDTSIRAYAAAVLLAFLICAGCAAPMRKAPVSELKKNPSLGDNESIQFIVAELQDVCTHYEALEDNAIEVTAPVTYYGRRQFWTWYLLVEESGCTLRCYTHHYRLRADRFAELLLESAMREGGEITVVGTLRSRGLETRMILYNGQIVRTDIRPHYLIPWMHYYMW